MYEKNTAFNLISAKRTFIILLCLSVVLFVSLRPVQVHASATMVNIASNYQDVIQVAPYLLPIILILVGVSWWWDNSDDLADKAMEIYNNGSVSLRNWANDVAQQIIDGSSAFKLTTSVATEINTKLSSNNQIPDDKKYIMLPPDLLSLRSLQPDEVLTSDIISSIDENLAAGNKLTQESNILLNTIKIQMSTWHNKLDEFRLQVKDMGWIVQSGLSNLQSTLNTFEDATRTLLRAINSNIHNDLNQTMKDLRLGIISEFTSLKSSLTNLLEPIRTLERAINDNTYNGLRNVQNALNNRFRELNVTLDEYKVGILEYFTAVKNQLVSLPATISQSITSALGGLPPELSSSEEKYNHLISGGDKIPVMLGQAIDLLSKYKTAFLAVTALFGALIGISNINDLLIFSFALGLLPLVVNLLQSFVSSDRNEAKRNSKYASKGG